MEKIETFKIQGDANGQRITIWDRWLETDGAVYVSRSYDHETWSPFEITPFKEMPFVELKILPDWLEKA
jgi:hypothetical protein